MFFVFFCCFFFFLDMTEILYLWIDGFSHSGASCTHDFAGLNLPYIIFLLIKWNQKLRTVYSVTCNVVWRWSWLPQKSYLTCSANVFSSCSEFPFVIRAKIYIASLYQPGVHLQGKQYRDIHILIGEPLTKSKNAKLGFE